MNGEVYDIRLKENFKMFVSGPSRCGKTVFVSKLLENIQAFSKQAPSFTRKDGEKYSIEAFHPVWVSDYV